MKMKFRVVIDDKGNKIVYRGDEIVKQEKINNPEEEIKRFEEISMNKENR